MKAITVRNVPAELAESLEREKRRRGVSLNHTVLALLAEALGISKHATRSNGLRRMAGTWTETEYREFERAVAPFDEIDDAIWR
ncbi:MAG: hypothetical protein F4Y86_09445 [Gammaproteobacteria bacterium]|nr:hypothetical protein [Gammaproteobacteria bacterium]MYB36129.1 hypothetical protein [Gammaproteobacteria bacterium]